MSSVITKYISWHFWMNIEDLEVGLSDPWVKVATCFCETFKESTWVISIVEMFDLFDLYLLWF